MSRGRNQISSGGLVYRGSKKMVEVALILRRSTSGQAVWGLPKGWVEPGESLEGAALREVKEETGVTARIIERLGNIQYQFYSKEERSYIQKTVHFYLMEYLSGDTADHDHEVDEVGWFSLKDAETRMTYPTEKTILQKGSDRLTAVGEA